ncbi:hypothetical protein K0I63_05450 [Shewanella rhizosphaerae]|uniref:hypothetical protein n=1 Tax=Shewanella rhizosphaerae TaxID=2864207 RepID=UPI001C65A816|nr:hypothetical protein [Shewanella rhizosphaerae]QYK13963.1 hypothetical protein K0I63_05450 [Shewanella rhizosphaerae]
MLQDRISSLRINDKDIDMIAQPVYEKLPAIYLLIAASTILLSPAPLPVLLAVIIFLLGARIFNMRSQNRRSDNPKRRRRGILPEALYNMLPYAYLLGALFVFRHGDSNYLMFAGAGLASFALFRLAQRRSYRQHQLPVTIRVI